MRATNTGFIRTHKHGRQVKLHLSIFRNLWQLILKKISGEQEKECINYVRVGLKNPSLGITVCHHSACLVIPNGVPRDKFFYPTLTLLINSNMVPKVFAIHSARSSFSGPKLCSWSSKLFLWV